MSVFSFLRTLTTRHYPHSPSTSLLLSAGNATIDRYIFPAEPTAANLQQTDGQADRETDGHRTLTKPCSMYYAGSAENVAGKTLQNVKM